MKRLLIKLSGEVFPGANSSRKFSLELIQDIIEQIKEISSKYHVGLVIGGGNFFRGSINNDHLKLEKTTAHNIGMLSTIVNGIILNDLIPRSLRRRALWSA